MKNESSRSLLVALVLAASVALFFVGINAVGATSGIAAALSLAAGMTTMAALDAFGGSATGFEKTAVHLDFDRAFVLTAIAQSTPQQRRPAKPPFSERGTVSARHLLSVDATLAAAKLRLDLEQVLHELADSTGLPVRRSNHPYEIAQELTSCSVLPPSLLFPIKDLSEVCNKAVHGARLTIDQANVVVDIGDALLEAISIIIVNTSSTERRQPAPANE